MKKYYLIGILIAFGIFNSCQNPMNSNEPEILTATYSLKSFPNSDQGFHIYILLKNMPENAKVKALVLKNKRFEKVDLKTLNNGLKEVNQLFLVNSIQIQNFIPPQTDERSDGIVFEVENRFLFKEIEFKLN